MVKLRLVLALIAFTLLPIATAGAVATPPCTSPPVGGPAAAMTIIPLSNGSASYCVSDFGWSDAWFVGSSPPIYDPRLDVLSGDDAPNLHFGVNGSNRITTSGLGWISPVIDGGTLSATHATLSPWTVSTPVHFIAGTTTAESLVHHPLGIDMLITTSLDPAGQGITQTFTITNVLIADSITDILFADYFNYHPNGSTLVDAHKGTVTYTTADGIVIMGLDDDTFIADGSMRGQRADDYRTISTFGGVPDAVFDSVQFALYGNPPSGTAFGPGDVAGALAWELGSLAPGESTSFTIFKLATPVPLPGTISLLAFGLAGLGATRRRSH